MRAAALPPLAALAMLAACGDAKDAAIEQAAEANAQVETVAGWDRVFAKPGEAIDRANDAGLQVGAYARGGDGYRAVGAPTPMSDADAARPNAARFAATGRAADRLDAITLSLSLDDAAGATVARSRFAALVRDYLGTFGIDDTARLTAAIEDGAAGTFPVAGVPATVAATKTAITIEFRHPTASTL